jgi:hypothetical protein
MSTELDLGKLVDGLNAGAAIPAVAPEDLRAAVTFFSEVRKRFREGGIHEERELGFFVEDLAAKCSMGADVMAAAIRAVIVELAFARIGGDNEPLDEVLINRTLAEIPLTGCDLRTPDAIVERVQKLITRQQN